MTAQRVRTRPSTRRTPSRTGATASDKSVAFVRKLLTERVTDEKYRVSLTNVLDGHDRVLRGEGTTLDKALDQMTVSSEIDFLKAQPYLDTSSTPRPRVSEEGLYEADGSLYLVVRSKSHRLYAKVLEGPDANGDPTTVLADIAHPSAAGYAYQAGLINRFGPDARITADRAEELSKWTTFCIRCGRQLTADESTKAGIGPVCRTKV